MAEVTSDPTLLTLLAVRLVGFASTHGVAARFHLDPALVEEILLDGQAYGWVTHSEFAGTSGWSLTDRGRAENERQVAAELDAQGARELVAGVHRRFLPLNARFLEAMTRWQIQPTPGNSMASNDHTDFRWDDRVISSLKSIGRQLVPLEADLVGALTRFAGYSERYNAALAHLERFEHEWADGLGIDSSHLVWIQPHEDLLASLGLDRADEV